MVDEMFGSGGREDAETFADTMERAKERTRDLERTARSFSRVMTSAFTQSARGARSFDDTLKSLYLRLSDLALRAAFKPLERGIASGFEKIFAGLFEGMSGTSGGGGRAASALPFAAGGVIGTPTYFPMPQGGLGLAGEAGPEAILPLMRGADGRLGVAASGGAVPVNVTINIATPDAESFRRSESYVTGQIARAVARGQRGL